MSLWFAPPPCPPGEADWAEIAFQDRDLAPKWKSATNNEAYVYAIDTVHHPWLRQREIREALNPGH